MKFKIRQILTLGKFTKVMYIKFSQLIYPQNLNNILFSILQKKYGKIFNVLNHVLCSLGAVLFTVYSIVFGNGETRMPMYNTWAPFDQVSTPNYQLVFLYQLFVTIICLYVYSPLMSLMIRFMSFGSILFKIIRISMIKSYEDILNRQVDG